MTLVAPAGEQGDAAATAQAANLYEAVAKYNRTLADITDQNRSVAEAQKFVTHAFYVFCRQRGITDYSLVRMEHPTLTRDGYFTFRFEEQRPT
jgi:hypothetical protein